MDLPLKPLFSLFCMVTTLHAAKPPDEFLDIPWRSNPARAKEILSRRPDLKISVDTATKITGAGGKFAGHPVDHIDLEIQGDSFTTGTVFLIIPPGNDKNGVPLRNQMFDSLSKSLTKQYGKVTRGGDGKHTQENWSWTTTEPLSSRKIEITIQLFYSGAPHEFRVRYAHRPLGDTGPNASESKDL
jgi:hypothetical protein